MGTYLITGASSGIGAACAENLASKGHTVILVARNMQKMNSIAKKLAVKAYCFSYDLNNVADIRSIFDYCREQGLKLDGLIYSAGIYADTPIKTITAEEFEKMLRVNCVAFAEMGKYFYSKRYSNDHARILAISSLASKTCDKGQGVYSASKAALNAIVKTMAKEFIRRDFLVNALLPATTLTPMTTSQIAMVYGYDIDLEKENLYIEANPIKIKESEPQSFGLITPNNLAQIISYLVSSDNRYITGALIPVSAGLSY